jgi:hypothetical protein
MWWIESSQQALEKPGHDGDEARTTRCLLLKPH